MRQAFGSLLIVLLCSIMPLRGQGIADPAYTTRPQSATTYPTFRYPVSKTQPEELEDTQDNLPLDLRDPENIKDIVEYDIATNRYVFKTMLGDREIGTSFTLTPEEYMDYDLRQSMVSYFRDATRKEFEGAVQKDFNLADMQFDIGVADKIFGPGGVRIQTQGSAEITMGLKGNKTDNPTLPIRSRSRTIFNFDEKVQMNINARVGEKVNFGMTYNTDASFNYDSKKIKLAYEGTEDEIIKTIEAGNVSMTTSNSLISGGAALFGIKTDMQFGKLRVSLLASQQESESRTINSRGGVQTTPFEIKIDEYEENRHFFLGHYFYQHYDKWMSKLPYISSGIKITRAEFWVTNKGSNFDLSRDVVAFTDLGEMQGSISNPQFTPVAGAKVPSNDVNTLYERLKGYPDARYISKVTQTFDGFLEVGQDYEKIESARMLEPEDYTLNLQLGYVSLRTALQADEVLAVAFEYTYQGKTYQVGEFSKDNKGGSGETAETTPALYLKLLKGSGLSPIAPYWELMMKNIYPLKAYSLQPEKFRLDILYQSDTTGVYLNYIPAGAIDRQLLLRVMNLDRLDTKHEPYADGFFDYVEGFTVYSENGKIIFPVAQPFGQHLAKMIGDPELAKDFVYQELYDSTKTVAQQIAEKNKFLLRGEYKASKGSEIDLGTMNVTRGSVRVKAGGTLLTENTDYSVDYMSGKVTITNQSVIDAGSPISVSLENQSMFSMQRKTMLGANVAYDFTKDFSLGATLMHLYEVPMTMKVNSGSESLKNTLWGVNMAYRGEAQWLTNALGVIPFLNVSAPSQIAFTGEFAHLIPDHYENEWGGGYSYLDDFESAKISYDLRSPYPWQISSVPSVPEGDTRFPESQLSNNADYGKNRALLAWYYIDGLFTRRNSTLTPVHIKNDADQLSNHYVREVYEQELFPNKQLSYGDAATLPVLNLAYYPRERGPYNLDVDRLAPDGSLLAPQDRFGGIMRKMDQTDFEASNIEFIEFWLLDPFIYNPSSAGGDLYFNLGEISEDILKDERKSFENGMPANGDMSLVDTTVWGRVPKFQSLGYSFDNTPGARDRQDVGINGLSTAEELSAPTYTAFLNRLEEKLPAATIDQMRQDPFSPINDPATDNYHYFRGSDYDAEEVSILDRYKRYNGTEGNSVAAENSPESYDISAKVVPDVEDINQDNTLNESESYFEYRISLRPADLRVGHNYVADKRETSVTLRNGEKAHVNWYLFRIPIRQYSRQIGRIQDFKNIRFMRTYLTNFADSVTLRFGTFQLVKGEWRTYQQPLHPIDKLPIIKGTVDVGSVSLEESGDREPVNYVMPPGVSRILDPSQPQIRQQNEQALSISVANLAPDDARATYKNVAHDLRQYKRMQMFVHAEKFVDDVTDLRNGELTAFIRLGSDYRNNYYEYEIPLKLTPHGRYSGASHSDQEAVWPTENFMDIYLEIFTQVKKKRNDAKREQSGVSFVTPFSEMDPHHPLHTVTIVGNPSLSDVKTMMIGVRNKGHDIKSGTIWVNELRLTDFNEKGGWAAKGDLNVTLSDFGALNAGAHVETAGFGGLDQSLTERRLDDMYKFNVVLNLDLGKLFPQDAEVSLPLYYGWQSDMLLPRYNPLDQDMELDDAIDGLPDHERDSIVGLSQDRIMRKSFSLSNVRVGIKSENPMPYDPANFTLGFAMSSDERINPTTEYENIHEFKANLAYDYTPIIKPWQPFAESDSKSPWAKLYKEFGLNYAPNNIGFQTAMSRYYFEQQLRDLTSAQQGLENMLPSSFRQDFFWDRRFSLRWDLTKNLNMSFNSGTDARIEEPHMQVNRKLNPELYEVWRDSVMQSILRLGTPMNYDQSFNASYTLPTKSIPVLDWTTLSAAYEATYDWERGAFIDEETVLGNTIQSQRQLDLNARLTFETLYNKSEYLKKVNERFKKRPSRQRPMRRRPAKEKKEKKFVQDVTLSLDSTIVIEHKLNTRRPIITVRRLPDSTRYEVKYRAISKDAIRIRTKDTVTISVTLAPPPPREPGFFDDLAQYSLRLLMMLRSANITYADGYGSMLPSFQPNIGNLFGQSSGDAGMTPGLPFAFGLTGEEYLDEADRNGWLIKNPNNINPAVFNASKTLTLQAVVEPIAGLKIDLNASRIDVQNKEIQFMFDDSPTQLGGSFSQTTVALGSLDFNPDVSMGYKSRAFDDFLASRALIRDRVVARYADTRYPANWTGGTAKPGALFDPTLTPVNLNSSDVLIPAFLSAYTGVGASSVELTPFPSILSLLPNWKITYDGLSVIPWVKKNLKAVTLNHQYRCVYSVGAFSSFLNWAQSPDGSDLGYIRDVMSNNPSPSSPYDISAASITESFSPLLGVNVSLKNNVTIKGEYKNTRNLNLNTSSLQIVEALNSEWVVGVGYRFANFNEVLGMKALRGTSNDLTVKADFSLKTMHNLIRKIEERFTQATSGSVATMVKMSADYALSKFVSLRAFFDLQINEPLVSSSTYPTTQTNYGISMRFSLTR